MVERFCIICGREFTTADPAQATCPGCSGPIAAPEPRRPVETKRAPEPPPGNATRRQDPGLMPPAAFTGEARILRTGQTILGLYEIRDLLGEGGMGSVYRARHNRWKIDLAVKVPKIRDDAQLQEQFIHEADVWVDLGLHPHIVSCFYVRRMEEQLLIFSECVDAGALKEHIGRDRLKSPEKIIDLAIQFAWGLGYAHARGLVHNDVKPGNALLSSDGTLKVNDFGLAGSVGSCTVEYASPEQALGRATTLKTDLWSWALTVLHMFNGELSWHDGSAAASILEDYRKEGPIVPGMPAMPPEVFALLRECFENEPERRPADMAGAGLRLAQAHAGLTGRPYPRALPREADLRADSLNNRALSLLDLGREADAEVFWERALQENPAHTPANLNLAHRKWKQALLTDDEMLGRLDRVEGQRADDAVRLYGVACLHAERGDEAQARAGFEQAARIEPALSPPQRWNAVSAAAPLSGHTQGVHALALTPDGRLASGAADGTVRIWDSHRSREAAVFTEAGFVTSIAFSPDGAWMATGSSDNTVRLWDVQRGKCSRQCKGHTDVVSSVAFSRDGERAISGSLDGSARVWERKSGRCLLVYSEHGAWVTSLLTVPGEDLVLSAGRDQLVRLWDPTSGRTVRIFERPRSQRKAEYGSVSLAGGRVLWAGYDRMALWDYASGRLLRIFRSCEDSTAIEPIVDGDLSPDGKLAVTAGNEDELRIWDADSGRCIHTFPVERTAWRAIFVDAGTVAAACGKELLRWTVRIDPGLELFQPVLSLPESGSEALEKQARLAHCLDQAGERLSRGQNRQAIAVLREKQAEPGFAHNEEILALLARAGRGAARSGLREWWRRATFKLGDYEGLGGVTSVRFSPFVGTLVAGQYEGSVGVYSIAENTTRRVLERLIGPVLAFVFLAEDDLLALSKNGDLVRWDLSAGTGRQVNSGLNPSDGAHLSAVLAEDAGYLAVLGLKGYTLNRIRLDDSAPLGKREFHPRVLRAKFDLMIPNVIDGPHAGYDYRAAVSPDGRYYTTSIMNTNFGRGAHPVYIWEVLPRGIAQVHTLVGHTAAVLAMAFSPDGETLASADLGGEIRQWRVRDGTCIRSIRQQASQFTAVAFSSDGRRLLTGDSEGRLFLWNASGERLATNKAHAGAVNAVAFASDDRFAASGGYDNAVMLWEFDWEFAV